jgi:hypothetical protein
LEWMDLYDFLNRFNLDQRGIFDVEI